MSAKSIFQRVVKIGSLLLIAVVLNLGLFGSQSVYAAALSSDMSITKTAPAISTVGGTITYQLTITNNGPDDASNVTVSDSLPAGTTFSSANAQLLSGVSLSGYVLTTPGVGGTGDVTITATTWPNGSSVGLQIIVNTMQTGLISNTATVSSATADPSSANNSSTASTNVTPVQVPTMNEWGMIIFLMLAGLGSLYYLRRNRAES